MSDLYGVTLAGLPSKVLLGLHLVLVLLSERALVRVDIRNEVGLGVREGLHRTSENNGMQHCYTRTIIYTFSNIVICNTYFQKWCIQI